MRTRGHLQPCSRTNFPQVDGDANTLPQWSGTPARCQDRKPAPRDMTVLSRGDYLLDGKDLLGRQMVSGHAMRTPSGIDELEGVVDLIAAIARVGASQSPGG